MFFIGDVHGKWTEYFTLIDKLEGKSIQVGDFGFGFSPDPPPWNLDHKFIRGNHDSPERCRLHPNYLGEYGITENDIFFVSGAYSIDKEYRTIGISWWEEEELSAEDCEKVLILYKEKKPKIVVAHDCPETVKEHVVEGNFFDKRRFINRTGDYLMPEMIKLHKPELWIFGHYHCSVNIVLNDTRYIGLDELEVFELKIDEKVL